ncbi:MAG: type II toxin-antitoxin system VapC family toxin [Terriglobales bacterium]
MKTFVMDASVGAKWATPQIIEPFAAQAHRFLRAYVEGTIQVVVPDLFWLEIGSFLWKAAKRGAITNLLAQHALEAMINRDFPTVPSRVFLPEAFKIACDFDRTIYDSTYVAMAAATGRYLITADERLVSALGTRFPVRWLGVF